MLILLRITQLMLERCCCVPSLDLQSMNFSSIYAHAEIKRVVLWVCFSFEAYGNLGQKLIREPSGKYFGFSSVGFTLQIDLRSCKNLFLGRKALPSIAEKINLN